MDRRRRRQHLVAVMFAFIRSSLVQLWRFLRRELCPLKGRPYFEASLDLIADIAADHRQGRSIQLIYVLLVLSTLLSLVQCLPHRAMFMVVTFDYVGCNHLPASILLSKALINITTFANYQNIYFRVGKSREFAKFRDVLIHEDRKLVLGSDFDFWKLINGSLRFYQVLVVGFELALAMAYVRFCATLATLSLGPLYLWALSYLSLSVGFVLFSVTFLLICVGGFTASVGLFAIKVLFERLDAQRRLHLRRPLNRFTPARLLRYRRDNVECMKMDTLISQIYGTFLVTFLWTNLPMNVSLITMVLLNNIPNMLSLYFRVITVFGQITIIIFFHFVAAMVTDRLHRPYTTIYSQFVRCRRAALSAHVRVSTNIEAFLVRHRYGVTYQQFGMNFGLVSMSAFLKFVFIYIEMVLYSYTLYRKSK